MMVRGLGQVQDFRIHILDRLEVAIGKVCKLSMVSEC